MKFSAERINELVRLEDDALVDTHEAAAFLGFKSGTLLWYRNRAPHCSPKFKHVGRRSIRYRMGDLRAFANGDPNGYQVAPTASEG